MPSFMSKLSPYLNDIYHFLIFDLVICCLYILQNYLREQPDNMKSFNIVAETAQFLNLVYSNITKDNIDLAIQLFESLNEFAVVSVNIEYLTWCLMIVGY
jgi:hypothetical protein